MFTREKIFTVYEKPEASDPSDRVVLLREGFSFGAFFFNVFWLILKRMWWGIALYMGAAIAMATIAELLQLSEIAIIVLQLLLQVMLGYHANDIEGWALKRRGYRVAGVLAAESEMLAARRYYEFAA